VEETTKKAFVCVDIDGTELCTYSEGLYKPAKGMSPERMVRLSKWVLDLEGK
jgi:hypothetical protein